MGIAITRVTYSLWYLTPVHRKSVLVFSTSFITVLTLHKIGFSKYRITWYIMYFSTSELDSNALTWISSLEMMFSWPRSGKKKRKGPPGTHNSNYPSCHPSFVAIQQRNAFLQLDCGSIPSVANLYCNSICANAPFFRCGWKCALYVCCCRYTYRCYDRR